MTAFIISASIIYALSVVGTYFARRHLYMTIWKSIEPDGLDIFMVFWPILNTVVFFADLSLILNAKKLKLPSKFFRLEGEK